MNHSQRSAILSLAALVLFCGFSQGADCPSADKIEIMNVTTPAFAEAGPYDISKIKSAKVFVLDNGKRIKVCLANIELKSYLSVDAVGAKKLSAGEFVLILNLSNGPNEVVAGTYSPKAGYGKPFWATAEVLTGSGKSGMFFSIGASDGTANLIEFSKNKACGTFDITGAAGQVKGTFNISR